MSMGIRRQPSHIMRDKGFELETKLVLLNFYEHACHGRSHSCDLTAQYGFASSDIAGAARRYRSLPESSRERSPLNHDSPQPDSAAVRLSRSDLRPEILNIRLSQNSSEISSGSFDSSNTDADDEMESNPSHGSTFSQYSTTTFPRKNRLSTVYSESELPLSPEIHSGRIPPPNSFPQVFKDSADDSSDLQIDGLDGDDDDSSISSNSDDELDTFREEVRHMKKDLQLENEELKSLGNTPDSEGHSRPLSPISDAARKLGKISDEIQQTYGPRIEQSMCRICLEQLTYDEFCNVLNSLLGPAETNWIMISAVMLFSRSCARYFFNQGIDYMSQIVEYTTNYLEDVAADFIINNGGWTTVNQFSENQLLEGGFPNYDIPDSDNNPSRSWPAQETLTSHPINANRSHDERHQHISAPLENVGFQPPEDITSTNNLDPTAVVALAAVICASFIYFTN